MDKRSGFSDRGRRIAWGLVLFGLGVYLLVKYGGNAIETPEIGTKIAPLAGIGLVVQGVLVVMRSRERP